jgi:hypothetical protein
MGLVPNPRALGLIALLCFLHDICCLPCNLGTIIVLPPLFFRVVLRIFCRYYLGMTEKARRAAAFLSW